MTSLSRKMLTLDSYIRYGVFSRRRMSPLPGLAEQQNCAARLKSDIRNIKSRDGATVTSGMSSDWRRFMDEVRESALTKDPLAFLEWPEIRATMFYDAPIEEWIRLRRSPLWPACAGAIAETRVGSPRPYAACPWTSGNLVHHAYHIAMLDETWRIDIRSFKSVLEIGGGYGSMCRLMHGLGFSGSYEIFDIPEFSALQRYFLTMTGLMRSGQIDLITDISKLSSRESADLAIMTWSLSEMPVEHRKQILEAIGQPRFMLIAYQHTYGDIDNRAYFHAMRASFPLYEWKECEIPHLPESSYLFGRRIKDPIQQ